MNELIAFLEARNAETQAWIDEDPSNRWASLYPTDEQHWIDRGITTIEALERDELESSVWEMYKDVHGFRPRHLNLEAMTNEEFNEELESLGKILDYEGAVKDRNLKDFINRIEEMKSLIAGSSTEDVIRIIADSEGIDKEELNFYGYESLEYELNLPYGCIKKVLDE